MAGKYVMARYALPMDVHLRRVFMGARTRACKQGIEWRLTYDEWWSVWKPHWRKRFGNLTLRRLDLNGGFWVGNVFVGKRVPGEHLINNVE